MDATHYSEVHDFIEDLMSKVRKEPTGAFDQPSLSTTAGIYYSACIFTWDNHHMTLRYAMGEEPEFMKYFLLTLLKFQRSNGFVPNCCSASDGGILTADFHAQPYLAQNAAVYLNKTGDTETIAGIYTQLEKYLNYWLKNYSAPYGLFRWGETWMSGFDNEVASSFFPPDLASLIYLECKAMGFIARKLNKVDAGFEKRSTEIKNAVNEYLWSESMGTYTSYNLIDQELITSFADPYLAGDVGKYSYISCPSLLPLFAGIADQERARRMIEKFVLAPEHFRSPYGIRSLSRSSEYYNNAIWGNPPRFGDWRRLTNSNWYGYR